MRVRWTRFPQDDGPIVWVSVEQLDARWRLDGSQHIGGGAVATSRPASAFDILSRVRLGRCLWMASLSVTVGGVVEFQDGRHRVALLRDLGACALPVVVAPECLYRARATLGTNLRATIIPNARLSSLSRIGKP